MSKIFSSDKFIFTAIFGAFTISFALFSNFATEKWVLAKMDSQKVEMKITGFQMEIFEKKLDKLQDKVDNNNKVVNEIKLMLIKQ